MYSIGTAARLLGVCVKTIRRWDKKGKVECMRTAGDHRRFPISEIDRLLNKEANHTKSVQLKKRENIVAIYGRVSSHKQKKRGDLDRQIDSLRQYAEKRGKKVARVFKDVGSGLNMKRRGLWSLIKGAKKGIFSEVIVNYKDRLTRIGFLYLKNYFSEFGVKMYCMRKTT